MVTYHMATYQDLLEVGDSEQARKDFVRLAINQHKSTPLYRTAMVAYEYDRKRNTTIMGYEKTLRTITGKTVPDVWSPNHKTTRNFFHYFVTQQNQYLLGNGVTWVNEDTGEKLGEDFDTRLQEAGKHALVGGVSFGFWNLDHMEVFRVTEFAPLMDEETGTVRAGVRWWQVDATKPLRATLYEEDGYTEYMWTEKIPDGVVLKEKQGYVLNTVISPADGVQIAEWRNYPSFPIVPFWGNPQRQSELVGIQEQIDAYDLIKNGFLNDLDSAQVYWIVKNAGGMDDTDLVRFLERLNMLKIADVDDGADAQPHTIEIPYDAREKILDRLERDLYKDYMALNVEEIKGGAVTATQIEAAYEPMYNKSILYEYCVLDFLQGIMNVAGIDDSPTFTRSKLTNVSESVQTVLQCAGTLPQDYIVKKVLTLLGDGDQAEDILKQIEADELETITVPEEEVADGRRTRTDGQEAEEA